ncbi:hypothetical protein AB6A40_000560 [Gnathostoma spinigerum]|uniref:LRRCT domain-containing protein n=1 Tax=Gnathostoma spinigerum TaxID=75299 RepID=A0ABD6E3K1_9BILA
MHFVVHRVRLLFYLLFIVWVKSDRSKLRPICTGANDCQCTKDVVICNEIAFTDNDELEPLRTPMLNLKSSFTAREAQFRKNAIAYLRQGGILPGHEKELVKLDFSFNHIYKIYPNAFDGMENLRVLKLSHNRLKNFNWTAFDGSLSWDLNELYLDFNQLKKLPNDAFRGLTNLKKLVLDYNEELQVTASVFGRSIQNLKSLSLDHCGFRTLDNNIFDELISLEDLSLRGNPITSIPHALSNMPTLVFLDLSFTQITEIQNTSISNDPKLKTILLEDTHYLYAIHDCGFCGLPALEELSFYNASQLYSIDKHAFGYDRDEEKKPNLKRLDLQFANLSELPVELFKEQKGIAVQLGGNPWNCTCENHFILKLDDGTSHIPPRCKYPKKLRNMTFDSLLPGSVCPRHVQIHRLFVSLAFLIAVLMVALLLYYLISTDRLRLRNVFYRPDMPHINYTNLSRDEPRNDVRNQPEVVASVQSS